MTIQFTKMHGLGNDFMVIDAVHQSFDLTPQKIAALSRRDIGVGFDQCLVVEPSRKDGVDFFYRIFNANGQEVAQCGNGARCLARFLQHAQLTHKKKITVETRSIQMILEIHEDETVTVNLGPPKLNPEDIPLIAPERQVSYPLVINETPLQFYAVNVGNPHAVLLVDRVVDAPVATLGRQISEHPMFPEQINVGFMQRIDQSTVQLRVYERGSGETKACGSGAVAAAAIGRLYLNLGAQVDVKLPGGTLQIYWPDLKGDLYLRGPASFVYEGRLLS